MEKIKVELFGGPSEEDPSLAVTEINQPLVADGSRLKDTVGSAVAIKKDPDELEIGNELSEPLFVAVKEEPYDGNLSDTMEDPFKSSDNEEKHAGETLNLQSISNEMDIPSDVNNPSCLHHCGEFSSSNRHLKKENAPSLQDTSIYNSFKKYKSTFIKMDYTQLGLTVKVTKAEGIKTSVAEDSATQIRERRKGSSPNANPKQKVKSKKIVCCETCGKGFEDIWLLKRHIRVHTGEKPFKCSVCEISFKEKGALVRHTRLHTGERPFNCSVCGKSFRHSSYMNTHMRQHNGEKPFECTVCEKGFAQKGALIRHIRCHTGERPYTCMLCMKAFKEKRTLTVHMRTHNGERP